MKKRSFIKVIFYGLVSLLLPLKISAIEKKIINPDLTDEQKRIMFGEGTERAGTSPLNFEKRKGSYHCANCNAKLFESVSKLIVEQGGLLLMRLYLELLKLKLIIPMV